jgi:hypothetical protein
MFKKMKISQQNKTLIFSFVIFLAVSILYSFTKEKTPETKNEKIYADTFIPKGFVLVPVELSNLEAVSALINQFGVIDLYAGTPQSQGSKKVASRVKILRAPLNPNQYAVLVPEAISGQIMKTSGPFWAVVQNKEVATSTSAPTQKNIQIEYYKGD